MHQPTSDRETDQSGHNLPSSPTGEQQHQHQPEQADEQPSNTDDKPQRFWKRHWTQWKAVHVHDKLNTIFTVVIAGATIVYVAETKLTLNEMRNNNSASGTQAGQLITQATAQANAANTQSQQAVEQTKRMGDSLAKTQELIEATNRLAVEAKRAADTADRQSRTTANQLELSERPWVSFYATVNQPLSISPDGAQVGIHFTFKNTGHSPAAQFWKNVKMLSTPLGALKEREELCAQTEAQQAANRKTTDAFFPGEELAQDYILSVNKPAIDFALGNNQGNMLPVIIVCVAYRPIFGNSVYDTGRIFDLYVTDPAKPGILFSVNVRKTTTVPVDRLFLASHFEGGTSAR